MGLVLGEMTSVGPLVLRMGLESTCYPKSSTWIFWMLAEHWEARVGSLGLSISILHQILRMVNLVKMPFAYLLDAGNLLLESNCRPPDSAKGTSRSQNSGEEF